jgi:hypothetical protein
MRESSPPNNNGNRLGLKHPVIGSGFTADALDFEFAVLSTRLKLLTYRYANAVPSAKKVLRLVRRSREFLPDDQSRLLKH